jgi:hypothetical protein
VSVKGVKKVRNLRYNRATSILIFLKGYQIAQILAGNLQSSFLTQLQKSKTKTQKALKKKTTTTATTSKTKTVSRATAVSVKQKDVKAAACNSETVRALKKGTKKTTHSLLAQEETDEFIDESQM